MPSRYSRPGKLGIGDITYILMSPESDSALSKELCVTRQAISLIRNGQLHKNIAPELPRRISGRLECTACRHWNKTGYCDLGVPEAEVDRFFAKQCNFFKKP